MNVSGPSGSNYNPFRTENDKPTSDAAITGMGKLNGDYGKTGNWFFRKVYDSVSALFTEKYWKGGWFAPKQSGDNAYSKELSGRVSSVSDRNSENSSNRSSVASSRISSLQSDKETELPEDDDEKHERMNATAAATKIQALVRGYIQRKKDADEKAVKEDVIAAADSKGLSGRFSSVSNRSNAGAFVADEKADEKAVEKAVENDDSAAASSVQSSVDASERSSIGLQNSGELSFGQEEDAYEIPQPISNEQYSTVASSQAARNAKALSQLKGIIDTQDKIKGRREQEVEAAASSAKKLFTDLSSLGSPEVLLTKEGLTEAIKKEAGDSKTSQLLIATQLRDLVSKNLEVRQQNGRKIHRNDGLSYANETKKIQDFFNTIKSVMGNLSSQ